MGDMDHSGDCGEGLPERLLLELYESKNDALTDPEVDLLTPILNSLMEFSDRYRDSEPIAVGGEKRIDRVYDVCLGRSVAMARPVKAGTRLQVEGFLREARLTAALKHPNIIKVHNIGLDADGVPFFTMELLPKDSLEDIVNRLRDDSPGYRREYTITKRVQMFERLCEAMAYAHSRGVVHLDLKPRNIHAGPFGELFVCDWGLARVLHEHETHIDGDMIDADVLNEYCPSGVLRGTPGFMAPEQIKSDRLGCVGSDVYALGAILYMLLTGELPVTGHSAQELLEQTRLGRIVPPRHRDARINRSLEAVVLKALALEPEQRYATVEELHHDIHLYMTGYAPLAAKAGVLSRAMYLIQRNGRVFSIILLFMLALIIVISAGFIMVQQKRIQAETARIKAEENLALFVAEQQRSQQLDREIGHVAQQAGILNDLVNARAVLGLIDKAMQQEMSPARKDDLLQRKAVMHFVLQEFALANEAFRQATKTEVLEELYQISRRFSGIKPNDQALLNDRQLAELINSVRENYHAARSSKVSMLQYTYIHHLQRRPETAPEEYFPLAAAMLCLLNNVHAEIGDALQIERASDGIRLDLSGMPFSVMRLNVTGGQRMNVLAPFGTFDHLDISRIPMLDITELGGIDARRLRMEEISFSNPRMLPRIIEGIRNLEELVINLQDYPPVVRRSMKESGLAINP